MTLDIASLEAQGKQAYQNKEFNQAADLFRQAGGAHTREGDTARAAEALNNMSVALLQAGRPQESLDVSLGTDKIFEVGQDRKRQAMALGNQAAALEALKRYDEALEKYALSAELFKQVQEGDLRALVLKSAAAIKLKTGHLTESAFKMMGSLEARQSPSFFARILNFFLRRMRKG